MNKSPLTAAVTRILRLLAAFIASALILGLLQGCAVNPSVPTEAVTTGTDYENSLDNSQVNHQNDPGNGSDTADADDSEAVRTYTVGVLLGNDSHFISLLRSALEAEAAKYPDIELLIKGSENDQIVQNNQLSELIKEADALIISIVELAAAQTVVDLIEAANLPVIFIDKEPSEEILKSFDKARFVGTTPSDTGLAQGSLIAELWKSGRYDMNNDGVMQYVMLRGAADSPETLVLSEFSVQAIQDAGIITKALESITCDWESGKAAAAMTTLMRRYGDEIEFVITNNDNMALGAIMALREAGYNSNSGGRFVPVVGIGASLAALDMISNGYMVGTVGPDTDTAAKILFAAAHNAAKGNRFLSGTPYWYDSSNVAVRIPCLSYVSE